MTGERLGHIGGHQPQPQSQPPASSTPPLPPWKAALLATPSISARRGVARSYSAPYEDTSTLVLTSRNRWFVDVRFALGAEPTGEASYWAFAGTSAVSFPGEGQKGERRRGAGGGWREGGESVEVPCLAHCVWKHEMDSKGSGEADEGDLYYLGNGQVVEVGVSGAGPSGKVEMYKEYWEEVEVGERCVLCD